MTVTDAAFIIGARHQRVAKPCQDYARASDNKVVVSDGCSSGGHTDFGSRVWSLAALDALTDVSLDKPELYLQRLLQNGRDRTHSLDSLDMLATVGVGTQKDGCYYGFLQGDGCLAFDLADGGIEFWLVEAPANAPLYPQYFLLPGAYQNWLQATSGQPQVAAGYWYDSQGELIKTQRVAFHTPFFTKQKTLQEATAFLVATDGVSTTPGRTAWETISALLDIQEPTGDFMHRRMGAMTRKQELLPGDDLAVGLLIG